MHACFFLGHRDAGPELLPALAEAIERHITEYGVLEFIVGNHGGFDRMASEALRAAKQRHPDIILTRLLAYHPGPKQPHIADGFDGSYYPPKMESVPPRYAIPRANRYMIDHASHLICYVWHDISRTYDLVARAKRRPDMTVTELMSPHHASSLL